MSIFICPINFEYNILKLQSANVNDHLSKLICVANLPTHTAEIVQILRRPAKIISIAWQRNEWTIIGSEIECHRDAAQIGV